MRHSGPGRSAVVAVFLLGAVPWQGWPVRPTNGESVTDFSDFAVASSAVVDTNTSAADLTRIAQDKPSLRPAIAVHPNADATLLDWLDENGGATVKQIVASRRAAPTQLAASLGDDGHKRRGGVIAAVIIGIVIVALAVAAAIMFVGRNPGSIASPSPWPTAGPVSPPDGDAQRAWITVPSANTKSNALIVDVHFDYQCPICKMIEDPYASVFDQLSDRGDIVLRYHTRIFLDGNLSNDASSRAAVAAACVDVADNTKYAAYHNVIYYNQPQEGAGFSDAQLRKNFAVSVGLTGDALATFQSCYDNQWTLQWVQDVEKNNLQAVPDTTGFPGYLFGGMTPTVDTAGTVTGTPGTAYGVAGTPTLFVQGKQLSAGLLFDSSGRSVAADADSLLAILQQVANG